MPARSGREYVESIRKQAPSIFLNGRQVVDVTASPAFQGALGSVSELYDLQHDPVSRIHVVSLALHGRSVHVASRSRGRARCW